MVPTEILAEQHARVVSAAWFEPLGLKTSSSWQSVKGKKRREDA